jgi:hypothetical protein
MRRMRTTVDLPDELLRRAKSEAALRGRKLKDLLEEGLRHVLDAPAAGAEPPSPRKRVTAHDLLQHLIFEDAESPPDLSTNKKYFDGFGK